MLREMKTFRPDFDFHNKKRIFKDPTHRFSSII